MEQGFGSGRFNRPALGALPAELMVTFKVLIVAALGATKAILPLQLDKIFVATRLIWEAFLKLKYR
jgi:hypothetical protein